MDQLRERVRAEVIAAVQRLGLGVPAKGAAPASQWSGGENRLLVLFSSREPVSETFFTQLKALASQNYSFLAVFSRTFTSFHPPQEILAHMPKNTQHVISLAEQELAAAAESCRAVLAPNLSLNTAAKLAVGICDSSPTCIITDALVNGRLVFVARDLAEMSAAVPRQFTAAPPAFVRTAEDHLRKVQQLSVQFVSADALSSAVIRAFTPVQNETPERLAKTRPIRKREFITAEDVWKVVSRGQKELVHSRDAIVTDQAREYAQSRGVALKSE